MIKETATRMRDDEPAFDPVVKQLTQAEAMSSLIIYEIGYGGKVKSVTPVAVCVVTTIMGCVDHTLFEGTEKEMAILVEAAVLSVKIDSEFATSNRVYKNAVEESLISNAAGSPFVLTFGRGLLSGSISVKAILMTMLGLLEQDIPIVSSQTAEDLMAALVMLRLEGQTDDMVRYLLGLNPKSLIKAAESSASKLAAPAVLDRVTDPRCPSSWMNQSAVTDA